MRTYHEKIETLRGALCDYHDVCDNRPDCFACDDTHACGELYGFGGPEEDGMCYDTYQPDVPGCRTIFHRARVDDQSVGAVPIPKFVPLSSDSEPLGLFIRHLGRVSGIPSVSGN